MIGRHAEQGAAQAAPFSPRWARVNILTKPHLKPKAKNSVHYYDMPKRSTKYRDSITVVEWRRGFSDESCQSTRYKGAILDLIAVGLVPQKMYDETGKSGLKSGRIIYPGAAGGSIAVHLKIGQRMSYVEWFRHPASKIPYESSKAKCALSNEDAGFRGRVRARDHVSALFQGGDA